jgi:formate/nitrite transporter FocA (FNT family)
MIVALFPPYIIKEVLPPMTTIKSRTIIHTSRKSPKPSSIIKVFTKAILALLFIALGLFLYSVVAVDHTLNPFGWAVVIVYVLGGWAVANDTCNS